MMRWSFAFRGSCTVDDVASFFFSDGCCCCLDVGVWGVNEIIYGKGEFMSGWNQRRCAQGSWERFVTCFCVCLLLWWQWTKCTKIENEDILSGFRAALCAQLNRGLEFFQRTCFCSAFSPRTNTPDVWRQPNRLFTTGWAQSAKVSRACG